MRILICNERFLFRFGVDRVLLLYAHFFRKMGHEVILIGNKMDKDVVKNYSDRYIKIPESTDYFHSNEYVFNYLKRNWNDWFNYKNEPDIALVAGWPFYLSLGFLKEKCGCCILHDYGAVPTDGMSTDQQKIQNKLRQLKSENAQYVDKIIAISAFVENTQSKIVSDVETSHVLLGADHLDLKLWKNENTNASINDVNKEVEKLKEQGFKLIFQPGRWEKNNYKNSYASIEISRHLNNCNIKHKILILSESISDLPEDVSDNYYCLGFIDDAQLKEITKISDVGFSPTLWEGFDLPLAEMQLIKKPMFVLNIGAHPEVVADPYFLCNDIKEMSEKIVDVLYGKFNINSFEEQYNNFKTNFTWKNSSDSMIKELIEAKTKSLVVIVDATNSCKDTANSGVVRTTRKLSKYLQEKANCIFVVWDNDLLKYVFPNEDEINKLCSYGGPNPNKIIYKSNEARETLEDAHEFIVGKKYFLFSEVVEKKKMEIAIPTLHNYGITVAAIFYDAIPVIRPDLCDKTVSSNHKEYMKLLANCDIVIPIAEHNKRDLEDFWNKNNINGCKVETVLLGSEMDNIERCQTKVSDYDIDNVKILFVSTLEPRKNHIRFIQGFDMMFQEHPELADKVELCMIGNKYVNNTEIPDYVTKYCDEHRNAKWLGVVDDETLKNYYQECSFTVYPSEIEGFGIPIIESVWNGKPCLCSDSGSIGELAIMGGCCSTNILDPKAISSSLYKLCTNKDYYIKLQHEACDRYIATWSDYSKTILDVLSNNHVDFSKYKKQKLFKTLTKDIVNYFNDYDGTKVIIVSNEYPPNIVGGAEIIAHNQVKKLLDNNSIKPIVFTTTSSKVRSKNDVILEYYDNVPIIKIIVSIDNYKFNKVNFYDSYLNDVFEELCLLIKPDVVHCHNMLGTSLGIVDIAKKLKIKTFVTLHDYWGICHKNILINDSGEKCSNFVKCNDCDESIRSNGIRIPANIGKQYIRRTLSKIDAYISPSQYLASNYIKAGFDYHKMNIIWNGIDVDRFKNVQIGESSRIRISYAGIFRKHKGVNLLIEAVAKSRYKDIIDVYLAGEGTEKYNYYDLADELGIHKSIHILGKLKNEEMNQLYEQTDIFVLPSIWAENQPVTITEAMACGVPVIVSDLGGSKELVKDGYSGLVFKNCNSDDLASKIDYLIDNRSLIKEYGKHGKEIISKHSFDNQVKEIIKLYDKTPFNDCLVNKALLIKGNELIFNINDLTNKDILLFDWIVDKKEFKKIGSCIVMPGEVLNHEELSIIEKYGIKLIVEKHYYDDLKDNINILEYSDISELIELIPIL